MTYRRGSASSTYILMHADRGEAEGTRPSREVRQDCEPKPIAGSSWRDDNFGGGKGPEGDLELVDRWGSSHSAHPDAAVPKQPILKIGSGLPVAVRGGAGCNREVKGEQLGRVKGGVARVVWVQLSEWTGLVGSS
ncbi:uncharacterized protein A4U43_C08F4420 [Asparagus officinalis]|nr:uncharacterized protein A4U43_C08F4420 [Asparagus officinalis]